MTKGIKCRKDCRRCDKPAEWEDVKEHYYIYCDEHKPDKGVKKISKKNMWCKVYPAGGILDMMAPGNPNEGKFIDHRPGPNRGSTPRPIYHPRGSRSLY